MLRIIAISLAIYALGCLFLYVKQRALLYFPTPELFHVDAQAMWLQTEDATLKIWKINSGESAILYFGGNAEAVEDNIADFKRLFPGFTVYLTNYRGFGGSTGSPTEAGLFNDALSIYDQLITQHTSISVIGRSLGSGVACYLAANRTVEKLVLTTPYDSIKKVAQSHYPMFPVKWLLKDSFDSARYAPAINAETRFLIAEKDEVIPLARSNALIQGFKPSKIQSHIIAGAQHNDIPTHPHYQELLKEFMSIPPGKL